MNKIGLIIAREYLSRVRKKSFIVMTILGPILFALTLFLPVYLATTGVEKKSIEIIDESRMFSDVFETNEDYTYTFTTVSLEEAKNLVNSGSFDGLLYIPAISIDDPKGVTFYSATNPSLSLIGHLSGKIEEKVENIKLINSGIDQSTLDNLKSNVSIATINLQGEEKESSSAAASVVGYVAAFLIYLFIFIYGAMCMRGVIEEKTSRIIEVIISSVRPFHLMMGKVIGIAGVGLTQFILWIILTVGIITIGGNVYASRAMEMRKQQTEQLGLPEDAMQSAPVDENSFAEVQKAIDTINIPLVIGVFLFYFLTGYLLYGALFAAVGSAVDSDADAQQFMLPVTIPLIISIISLTAILNDPNGPLAVWMSLIPFTSPIVMMMRVPFGVPMWQLGVSMILMILGFIFTIWLGSRIYRIGILMHGTKVNYRVLAKWFLMKN